LGLKIPIKIFEMIFTNKEQIMNYETQYYKGIPFKLIDRKYGKRKALRYILNNTNQNVWIPLKHLEKDGTLRLNENIDYIFRKSNRQLELSGITDSVIGIKRKTIQ
jgi:hypothetical protein